MIFKSFETKKPISDIKVQITNSPSIFTTDSEGQTYLSSITVGSVIPISFVQDSFDIKVINTSLITSDDTKEILTIFVSRILKTVTFKRNNIHLFPLDYGHWWVEIQNESYGWWPVDGDLGHGYKKILNTVIGVRGCLNGPTNGINGAINKDPHHGEEAETMFHPIVINEKNARQIEADIKNFASDYTKSHKIWQYPFANCHTFQESMMKKVGLKEPKQLL